MPPVPGEHNCSRLRRTNVVYRHVATKAELRDVVVGRWVEATMPPLRAIAALPGPAPQRLRRLFDALIAVKRHRATDDPELFSAYRTLAADAQSVAAAHLEKLVGLARCCSRHPGSTTRPTPPCGSTRLSRRRTNEVWQLLTDGLCAATSPRLVRAGGTPKGVSQID